MNPKYQKIIRDRITETRESVLNSLREVTLKDILKSTCYAEMLCHISARETIRPLTDSHLRQSIGTKMGNAMENIEIDIASERYGQSCKSSTPGIDLDIILSDIRLLLQLKNGSSWGNSQSTKTQKEQFAEAKKRIAQYRQMDRKHKVYCVMGIATGKKKTTTKLKHADVEISGQTLWYIITGEKDFYLDLANEIHFGVETYAIAYAKEKHLLYERLEGEWDYVNASLFRDEPLGILETWRDAIHRSCGNFSPNDCFLEEILEAHQLEEQKQKAKQAV